MSSEREKQKSSASTDAGVEEANSLSTAREPSPVEPLTYALPRLDVHETNDKELTKTTEENNNVVQKNRRGPYVTQQYSTPLSARLASLKEKSDRYPVTIIGVSHAERLDRIFPKWLDIAFTARSNEVITYAPYNLNMPLHLIRRDLADYEVDPPITEHGRACAALTGRRIAFALLQPTIVFSSPEMRCIQTAWSIMKALGICHLGICVEPSLAEWAEWMEIGANEYWMEFEKYEAWGIKIEKSYIPLMKASDYPRQETPAQYFERIQQFYLSIVTDFSDSCALVVANSTALYILRDGKGIHPMNFQKAEEMGEHCTCDMHVIKIKSSKKVKQAPEVIMPFTRTLLDSKLMNPTFPDDDTDSKFIKIPRFSFFKFQKS